MGILVSIEQFEKQLRTLKEQFKTKQVTSDEVIKQTQIIANEVLAAIKTETLDHKPFLHLVRLRSLFDDIENLQYKVIEEHPAAIKIDKMRPKLEASITQAWHELGSVRRDSQ